MNRKNKEKKPKNKKRMSLNITISLIIFLTLVIVSAVIVVLFLVFKRFGIIENAEDLFFKRKWTAFAFILISIVSGWVISFFISKIPSNPYNTIINSMNALAGGDLSIRLTPRKHLPRLSAFDELSRSFNKMAEDLEKTEMLRSDFINNFSHEFKTPIVSISGFAKLIKRGNLSQEQQAEYAEIIETESLRLSQMATNVLNLTKVENQSILTDKKSFNLSEQIRKCVLLSEKKWQSKNIEPVVDFDEFEIVANEELLEQVWINLIDNAIKFSPEYSEVTIRIAAEGDFITVTVSNRGEKIPESAMPKIWNKFYQADESHKGAGNGIGLAIVKKIVSLHGGSVGAVSDDSMTTFTVKLRKN